jgi:hypothetical protein
MRFKAVFVIMILLMGSAAAQERSTATPAAGSTIGPATTATSPAKKSNGPAKAAKGPAKTEKSPAKTTITLFDKLKDTEDVIYLLSNSSFVWGPDPHGLSEEITFTGLVTVPKWPMPGYERRTLLDNRQQIDIELSESTLKGESYLLGGIVHLGEHPDLRSLGTITSPGPADASAASKSTGAATQSAEGPTETFRVAADTATVIQNFPQVLWSQLASEEAARLLMMEPKKLRSVLGKQRPREAQDVRLSLSPDVTERMRTAEIDSNLLLGRVLSDLVVDLRKQGLLDRNMPAQLVVPHDFVVARKVLLTTAKGVLYNEVAVPVKGRLDSIPPIHRKESPAGVNVFHGMELPIPLLDKDKNVDGWFYSKAHVATPVRPIAIEKETIQAEVKVRAGDREETIQVEGPAEIHHGVTHTYPNGRKETEIEVVVLGLRGTSAVLGGNIMIIEAFSDKDKFSRGRVVWDHSKPETSPLNLYLEVMTPSGKLHNVNPITVSNSVERFREDGIIGKGNLKIPALTAVGAKPLISTGSQALYNDADRAVVELTSLKLEVVDRPASSKTTSSGSK